jgi:hypothetical protein
VADAGIEASGATVTTDDPVRFAGRRVLIVEFYSK